jgi:hypothetical protein
LLNSFTSREQGGFYIGTSGINLLPELNISSPQHNQSWFDEPAGNFNEAANSPNRLVIDDSGYMSRPVLKREPNACYMCARIKFHIYDK